MVDDLAIENSLRQDTIATHTTESVCNSKTAFADRDDALAIFDRQLSWGHNTFGPGLRTNGNVAHIRKELKEYESNPSLHEAADLFILAMDTLLRCAAADAKIGTDIAAKALKAITDKMTVNESRQWPDWRDKGDVAIEHIRTEEELKERSLANDTSNGFPEVGALLRNCADTFDERNAVYGNNYQMVGNLMVALHPEGITLKTADDHNRFHLWMLKVVKMSRYAKNYTEGGHEDSAVDDIVYTAMVAGLDQRAAKTGQ